MEPETRRAFLLIAAELEADGLVRSARLGRELAGVAERRVLDFRVSFLWGVVFGVLLVATALVWVDVVRTWVVSA